MRRTIGTPENLPEAHRNPLQCRWQFPLRFPADGARGPASQGRVVARNHELFPLFDLFQQLAHIRGGLFPCHLYHVSEYTSPLSKGHPIETAFALPSPPGVGLRAGDGVGLMLTSSPHLHIPQVVLQPGYVKSYEKVSVLRGRVRTVARGICELLQVWPSSVIRFLETEGVFSEAHTGLDSGGLFCKESESILGRCFFP